MNIIELYPWFFSIIGGFLLGSVMFSQLIPKYFLGKDISAESDDHNPGATNVFIVCGPAWGMLCLGLDLLKGFLPVFFSFRILSSENLLFSAVMAAPVLGHALAPFNHFRGGKCIATTFGVLLGLFPMSHIVLLLALIYIVFSTILKISPNRIRSIAAFGLFGVISLISLTYSSHYAVAIGCMVVSIVTMLKHSKLFAVEGYAVS